MPGRVISDDALEVLGSGVLGIGLMLFSLRALDSAAEWKEDSSIRILGDEYRAHGNGGC